MANANIEAFINTYGSRMLPQQLILLRAAADYFDSTSANTLATITVVAGSSGASRKTDPGQIELTLPPSGGNGAPRIPVAGVSGWDDSTFLIYDTDMAVVHEVDHVILGLLSESASYPMVQELDVATLAYVGGLAISRATDPTSGQVDPRDVAVEMRILYGFHVDEFGDPIDENGNPVQPDANRALSPQQKVDIASLGSSSHENIFNTNRDFYNIAGIDPENIPSSYRTGYVTHLAADTTNPFGPWRTYGSGESAGVPGTLETLIQSGIGVAWLGNQYANNMATGAGDDYLDGGVGNDTLDGANGADTILGGAGDDAITGGAGSDYLEGGTGSDSYVFNAGDGIDTILDADGLGTLSRNGISLTGGQSTAPNRWEGTDGSSYTLIDVVAGVQDLLIQSGSDSILVNHFSDGELGIHLAGEVAPAPFTQAGNGITIFGDRMPLLMPWDYWLWLMNPTWPYLFDVNGNMVRTNLPQPFYADKIFDTPGDDSFYAGHGLNVIYAYNGGNNHISTGLNDDYILGGSGRDRVFSGGMTDTIDVAAGDDIVYGEDGGDVIEGGAGDDFLSGGAAADALNGGDGNDQVYGGDSIALQNAIADSGLAASGQGELLGGGAGDDMVIGDATDDALLGGVGDDALAGREGNDMLMGDSGLIFVVPPLSEFDGIIGALHWPMGPYSGFHSPFSTAPMLNILFERIDHGAGSADRYEVRLSSLNNPEAPRDNWITPAVDGGSDQLYGGSGDDWLFGEFGADVLTGGIGNDVLVGGDGNDVLVGGTGNDVMVGGAGSDTYIINAGDGVEYIYDSPANGGINTIIFGAGVNPADVHLFLGSLGLDLGNGTVVHIEGVDYSDIASTSSIQSFQFADGTMLTAQQLTLRGLDVNGTDGDDALGGTNMNERMVAGAGNDTLSAAAGDDVLTGGSGNDMLIGGAGNDTYLFNIGDGADAIQDDINLAAGGTDVNTLKLGAGVTVATITPVVDASGSVTLGIGNGDSVFIGDIGNLAIQNVQFADGSTIAVEFLLNLPPVANPDAITVFEDGGALDLSPMALLQNDTDPNLNDIVSILGVGASAVGADVALVDGQVRYDIGNRFQELAAGDTATDSFSYMTRDSHGATASSAVTVTIVGVNDAPSSMCRLAIEP
jgi:trimeric autotransporter adhesin